MQNNTNSDTITQGDTPTTQFDKKLDNKKVSNDRNRMSVTPWKVLAPMVRAGTLPLRLLCLGMGAHAVFSEELICHKMLSSERLPKDKRTGLVNYVLKKNPNRVVFQTCDLETDHVVFQIGTSDATRASQVAKMLTEHGDISGFDLNCGCPKHFSISGGMGAALLKNPTKLESIIKKLRCDVNNIPITCKIRLLDTEEETIALARRIEAVGAHALTVHCRETHHRPSEPAQWGRLKPVVDAVNIPVIANGDLYSKSDIVSFLNESGADGVMFARGAMGDPSVFGSDDEGTDNLVPTYDLLRDYLRIASLVNNNLENTKYTMLQMLRYAKRFRSQNAHYVDAITKPAVTFPKLREAFNLSDEECTLNGPISWDQLRLSHPAKKNSFEAKKWGDLRIPILPKKRNISFDEIFEAASKKHITI